MREFRIAALILTHMSMTTLASIGFRMSATSNGWKGFLLWQIAGNLCGFAGVLALTFLLKIIPLHVAYPVTQGLAIIGIQVLAALLLFRETVYPVQWLGTVLILAGIVLISMRHA